MKRKRRVLNLAFKQFQRLPDVSRIKVTLERRELNTPNAMDMTMVKLEAAVIPGTAGACSLAE